MYACTRPHSTRFNPRSPRGGATFRRTILASVPVSFNPRSPRGGATCSTHAANPRALCFNPRSPRGGATRSSNRGRYAFRRFNPRSPRGGATQKKRWRMGRCAMFQSTLPTRGSDGNHHGGLATAAVSIHAPHEGERLYQVEHEVLGINVSIHAPHEGERLEHDSNDLKRFEVSIHAPHEGERPPPIIAKSTIRAFQSTLPTRGSDIGQLGKEMALAQFQSTLPTRGSDAAPGQHRRREYRFNPRSPRGGATAEKCICMQHFREFTEYYPLRHGDACCIAPQDCIIQAFFGAKKRCFYVRLCFALKNKGVRG